MIGETILNLRKAAETTDAILVAYSDGKDSRVVMDLCVRIFKRVEAFFLYFIPGLECEQIGLAQAERRWGVKIRHYPDFRVIVGAMKAGMYCHPSYKRDDLPQYKLEDAYQAARIDSGIRLIATGIKKSDSSFRRRFLAATKDKPDIIHPLIEWNKYDVLSYLQTRAIPVPDGGSGATSSGVDLSVKSLLWLHDTWPDDFRRLCEYFPFAEAVVWRRKFYGKAA